MRIGFVVYGSLAEQSGGFRYDRKLVEGVRERGHEVEIVGLPWESYGKALLHNASTDLRSKLREFDVVLQDELCHPSLVELNRTLDVPLVSVVHHLRSSEPRPEWKNVLYRAVERRYVRNLDAAVCNSETTRRSVTRLCRLPTTVASPAGDRFAPASRGVPISSTDREFADPFELVFLGNLVERKGLHVLLPALATVAGNWHLTVIGSPTDTAYATRIRRLRNRLGLRDDVTVTGRLPDEAVAERLANAHVLVGPSLYEGLGLVYLEGMAFGLPAIATSAGGASEIVSHGENGFLLPPDDSRAIAEAIRILRDDRDLLRRMSETARKRYEEQPSWAETTETVVGFIAGITDPNVSSSEP